MSDLNGNDSYIVNETITESSDLITIGVQIETEAGVSNNTLSGDHLYTMVGLNESHILPRFNESGKTSCSQPVHKQMLIGPM